MKMKEKKETNIHFRISENSKKELQHKADADGRTLSNYILNKLKNDRN